MDLTDTIQPKSDQANADDFLSGDRTFTIAEVRRTESADQPVEIVLAEFPAERPWKPNKSMRRVLVLAWGKEAQNYVGRRVTLFCDETVTWAGQKVGGIRIRAMSHIDKPLSALLTTTRGKKAPYKVQPLVEDRKQPVPQQHPAAISKERQMEVVKALQGAGIEAPAAMLAKVVSIVGRQVASSSELTEAEAIKVIDFFDPTIDRTGEPQ